MRRGENTTTPTAYFPQLDALRGLAVFFVLMHHYLPGAGFQQLALGPAAVRLFFVISGFLITGILLRSRQQIEAHKITLKQALKRFMVRRSLRILPPYLMLLAIAFVANTPGVRHEILWHLTYTTNFFIGLQESWDGYLTSLWSLAVEEQFYLLWPLLILKLPQRWLRPTIIGAIVLAPLSRWLILANGIHPIWMATALITNLDTLGAGALLALVHWERQQTLQQTYPLGEALDIPSKSLSNNSSSNNSSSNNNLLGDKLLGNSPPSRTRLHQPTLLPWALWLGLPCFLICRLLYLTQNSTPLTSALVYLALAGCFAWLVQRSAQGFSGWVGRCLEAEPLRYLGKISYGIYLYHLVVLDWTFRGLGISEPQSLWVKLPVSCGLTLAIATVSWFCWEKPWLSLKERWGSTVTTTPWGLAEPLEWVGPGEFGSEIGRSPSDTTLNRADTTENDPHPAPNVRI